MIISKEIITQIEALAVEFPLRESEALSVEFPLRESNEFDEGRRSMKREVLEIVRNFKSI